MQKGKNSTLWVLILAGEAVFFLPFVLVRIFRPSMLELFQVSNQELGSWFALYGTVAMASYFFGGPLADRFQSRKLMALALVLTAVGGFWMASEPGPGAMRLLYAFWGFSTICLFWAAMIRSTREWGGQQFQGRAFGWLEGGRGAVAALLGTLGLLTFYAASLQMVILFASVLVLLLGVLVWFTIPDMPLPENKRRVGDLLRSMADLLARRRIWILGGIIICAYGGYKITDDFSLYAREVLGFTEGKAALVGTAALWWRALVAVSAGWAGDRFSGLGVITGCFFLTLLTALGIGLGLGAGGVVISLGLLLFTAIGIYGVRSLYFAILAETGIPKAHTGRAVGLLSFVGFSPDIFMSPWMGKLLDASPGAPGHQHVFLLLACFAGAGGGLSLLLKYFHSK